MDRRILEHSDEVDRGSTNRPWRSWPAARRPKHLDTSGSTDTCGLFTLLLVGTAIQQEVMEEGGADRSEGPTAAGAGDTSPRTPDDSTDPALLPGPTGASSQEL